MSVGVAHYNVGEVQVSVGVAHYNGIARRRGGYIIMGPGLGVP